ncbi:odorant receptor 94a-like [Colias croceus]|uniref:odorant receptor 94a-like n=1 Tax=Colias crocea TaxID=72248 RepID=UPI001E27DE0A|nr:odorant receptor 94a-like [Colias croceus]
METKLSYHSVAPHFLNLRVAGYYQIDIQSSRMKRFIHRIYMGFVLSLMIIYTIQQALKVYEVRENLGQVMGTMFLFLTHTDAIYKQILLWVQQGEIENLIAIMKGPRFNQCKKEHEGFLLNTARYAKLLLYCDNGLAISTCFLWFVYPIYLHLKGNHIEFAIWLPYDENKDPNFYITSLYVWITTTWLAFSNTTMDVTISTLLSQSKAQLSILCYNLSTIVEQSKEESSRINESLSTILQRRFKDILLHHMEIVKFTKSIENIFGNVLAYQFLIGGWIICASVYRLVDIEFGSLQFFSMLTYITCIMFEMFICCYYGSEVTYESIKLTDAAYCMDWVDMPVEIRKSLIIFMEGIKRPIRTMAGHIIPLSNDTFISVVKSSYSFYALLKSTSE